MKNMTSLQVFKTTVQYWLVTRQDSRYANGLGILELDGTRYELKTERSMELSQHESWWVQTIIGYSCIHSTFPYRIKRKVRNGGLPFWATTQRLTSLEHEGTLRVLETKERLSKNLAWVKLIFLCLVRSGKYRWSKLSCLQITSPALCVSKENHRHEIENSAALLYLMWPPGLASAGSWKAFSVLTLFFCWCLIFELYWEAYSTGLSKMVKLSGLLANRTTGTKALNCS
jgi:hypothetical protein